MTKRGTVFRVFVERFDVGAVPVPMFHLDQFGRGGDVQVGQDVRVPVHVIELPLQRQRLLRLVDGPQLPGPRVGGGYSYILTNLDVSTPTKLVEVEHWYRHRTDIEALNKDAKHDAALRHLPSGDRTVNTVWMWAALLACAISNWIQEITRHRRRPRSGPPDGGPDAPGTVPHPGPGHPHQPGTDPATTTRGRAADRRPHQAAEPPDHPRRITTNNDIATHDSTTW